MTLRECPAKERVVLSWPVVHRAVLFEDGNGLLGARDGEVRPIHISHAEVADLHEAVAKGHSVGLAKGPALEPPVRARPGEVVAIAAEDGVGLAVTVAHGEVPMVHLSNAKGPELYEAIAKLDAMMAGGIFMPLLPVAVNSWVLIPSRSVDHSCLAIFVRDA